MDYILLMNSETQSIDVLDREPSGGSGKKPLSPLNLTSEQVRREARKLHKFREDLKTRQTIQETVMRSSPLGRDD